MTEPDSCASTQLAGYDCGDHRRNREICNESQATSEVGEGLGPCLNSVSKLNASNGSLVKISEGQELITSMDSDQNCAKQCLSTVGEG